jgi:signal transduction histidine kinase
VQPSITADPRAGKLIEAGLALASELSLPKVLQRIVDLATEVTGARYGALGVIGPDGWLVEFVTTGITPAQRAAIGNLPRGHGILGVLIDDARPLRLPDLTAHPKSYGFPPNHPPMRSFLGVPVTARGEVFGNLYMTEKQGAPAFDQDDEQALLILAAQAGVAVENARLYAEAQRRQQDLEATSAIATALLAGGEGDAPLALIARVARSLSGATAAAVVGHADPDGPLVVQAVDGPAVAIRAGAPLADPVPAVKAALASGRTQTTEDGAAGLFTGAGPILLVPLAAQGRTFGLLGLARSDSASVFDDETRKRLEVFAGQAALALEYARAQRELERLAVLGDRERIARELHDGAIQALFAVGLDLQAGATLAADDRLRRRLRKAVEELDTVIRDLRNYIFELRPGLLGPDQRLDQALAELVAEVDRRSGVTLVTDIDGQAAARLEAHADDVLQFVREALTNVARHAEAMTCRISLQLDDDGQTVMVEVDDDGRGFDPATPTGGQGLRNLHARGRALGGRTELSSTPGEGTTIRLTVPVSGAGGGTR